MSYVDLHCHVLPALDDGPLDLDAALQIVRGLRGLGFTTICPTPHQKADQFLPSAEAIAAAFDATRAALAADGELLTEAERQAAEQSRDALLKGGKFAQIHTEIVQATTFYPAEEYHQDYYKKNPIRYNYYRRGCGRDARLQQLWGSK